MWAVLIFAYVVLLVAIESGEGGRAQENSAKLTAIEAAVKKNSETLQTITQSLRTVNNTLNLLAHQDIINSCKMFGVPHPNGSRVETECITQTCYNGKWKLTDYINDDECCEFNDDWYPDGSTIEGDPCKQICNQNKWIVENSPLCCALDDGFGGYFPTGTNIIAADGVANGANRTCEDGNWNVIFYRPVLDFILEPRKENVESIRIRYNPGINSDYGSSKTLDSRKHWVDSLNRYFNRHRHMRFHNLVNCSEDKGKEVNTDEICYFNPQWLDDKCTKAEDWGYPQGTPCVILKMGNMMSWTPEVYETIEELPADMPEELKEYIKQKTDDNGGHVPKMVWVDCKCENPAHEEHISEIDYTPWRGFPAYYFPYNTMSAYFHSPIVAVRFVTPAYNVPINIKCKAYAKNILHHRNEHFGVINFELLKLD